MRSGRIITLDLVGPQNVVWHPLPPSAGLAPTRLRGENSSRDSSELTGNYFGKYDKTWKEYQKLVLEKLDRHQGRLDSIDTSIGKLREDVVILKVKATFYGAIGGLIPVLIAALVAWMKTQP